MGRTFVLGSVAAALALALNPDRNAVTAYAFDISGKLASDSWPLECK